MKEIITILLFIISIIWCIRIIYLIDDTHDKIKEIGKKLDETLARITKSS